MLPLPFEKYLPKIFTDNADDSLNALVSKAEEHIEEWRDEILEMFFFKMAERCPSNLLGELNYYLNAGFQAYDSDDTKRKKIFNAIKNHKKRGTWADDAKLRIDAIAGYDSEIFRAYDIDDWILVGDGLTPSDYYWSSLGVDGIDDGLGIYLIGEGTEVVVSGNIYIDCHPSIHTSILTVDQISQIVLEISSDVVPAYFRIYLGYIDSTGAFIVYSGGTIE